MVVQAAYFKVYYEQHRQEILSQQKAYRQQQQEKLVAAKKAYYQAHRAEILARVKAYQEKKKQLRNEEPQRAKMKPLFEQG